MKDRAKPPRAAAGTSPRASDRWKVLQVARRLRANEFRVVFRRPERVSPEELDEGLRRLEIGRSALADIADHWGLDVLSDFLEHAKRTVAASRPSKARAKRLDAAWRRLLLETLHANPGLNNAGIERLMRQRDTALQSLARSDSRLRKRIERGRRDYEAWRREWEEERERERLKAAAHAGDEEAARRLEQAAEEERAERMRIPVSDRMKGSIPLVFGGKGKSRTKQGH